MLVDIYVCTELEGEPYTTIEGAVIPSWESIKDLPIDIMFTDNKFWVPPYLRWEISRRLFRIR